MSEQISLKSFFFFFFGGNSRFPESVNRYLQSLGMGPKLEIRFWKTRSSTEEALSLFDFQILILAAKVCSLQTGI